MAFDTESSLSITVKCDGDGVLIIPHGDLDEETLPTFEFCLGDALDTRRTPIRIDLSQVCYIDIVAYRAIIRFGDRCERCNVVNEWLRPSGSVELMFRSLGCPRGEVVDADFRPVPAARP